MLPNINDIIYQQIKEYQEWQINIICPHPLSCLPTSNSTHLYIDIIKDRMSIKYVCTLTLLALHVSSMPLKQAKVVKALNCGLKEGSTKSDDIKYESDVGLVTGSSVDVDYHSEANAQAADMKYAMDKEIYMYERHTYSEMTYALPVKTGVHTVILKFAEMYFQKPGQRVFNIKIGDQIVVQDMDPIAKSGSKYAAHEEFIEVEVKAGAVYHKGVKVPNGIKKGQLQLSFAKGKADNPIIQGIVVYNAPVAETNQADFLAVKKNWGSHQDLIKAKKENELVKERLLNVKKNEKIVIRNDQLLIEEDDSEDTQAGSTDKFGTIRSFLMSPIGILIWAALFGWQLLFLYNKVFLLGRASSEQPSSHEE